MRRKKALKERRQKLFDQLEKVINDLHKNSDIDTMLYILDLWRYIADVHKEGFSVVVDK